MCSEVGFALVCIERGKSRADREYASLMHVVKDCDIFLFVRFPHRSGAKENAKGPYGRYMRLQHRAITFTL